MWPWLEPWPSLAWSAVMTLWPNRKPGHESRSEVMPALVHGSGKQQRGQIGGTLFWKKWQIGHGVARGTQFVDDRDQAIIVGC